jgi:hypothetical protein
MRVFVQYDSSGAIRSLVAMSAQGGIFGRRSIRRGHSVAELEGEIPQMKLHPTARDVEALRKAIKDLRVEPTSSGCKLVKTK